MAKKAATVRDENRRSRGGLILLSVIGLLAILLAATLVLQVKARQPRWIDGGVHSDQLADYSADPRAFIMPAVQLVLIQDAMRDSEPVGASEGYATVAARLDAPVPTATPVPSNPDGELIPTPVPNDFPTATPKPDDQPPATETPRLQGTPTPTSTPRATHTLRPSNTPRATSTPRASSTPTPRTPPTATPRVPPTSTDDGPRDTPVPATDPPPTDPPPTAVPPTDPPPTDPPPTDPPPTDPPPTDPPPTVDPYPYPTPHPPDQ